MQKSKQPTKRASKSKQSSGQRLFHATRKEESTLIDRLTQVHHPRRSEIVDELIKVAADPRHPCYRPRDILEAICLELGCDVPCARGYEREWITRSLARRGIQWGAA